MPLRPRTKPQSIEIPEQARTRVDVDTLIGFAADVFVAYGVGPLQARCAAEALCYGDLVGQPEHGITNLFRTYLPMLEQGLIAPDPEPLVIADRGAAALIDYRHGLGLWAVSHAMDRAVARASRNGVGLVSLRGVSPFGRAGFHAARALSQGMIGMVMATGSVREGVNPLGVAAPAGAYPSFVFDLDSTAQAGGLTLMVEVFAGLLSGVDDHDHDTGLMALAIAPTALRSADGFYRAASALFGSVLGWESDVPIRYPGWPEAEHAEQCRALGVPLDGRTHRDLATLAGRLGLRPPTTN
ncbi:Malate/lactate/ureidoglycolate dehydrogenase, LDH2 family [Amycolatopsis xylanica]|uniref:Malate/lactate/ureidoglycolate dehydrogenase, LDH2 family n=1 Tax=Amycolatopsis xylanica TaxID=589385 RepID=A0A1H3L2F4_9PSEU|nr:Ldh family oxidoreductase [Amycolatopsis xylanica]SDY58612.1 Malate/lactate/ureidoglycolate dehydrogenase, LDH2 family [Amycolatopsis xylanica]